MEAAGQKSKEAHDRAKRAFLSPGETGSVLELFRWFENLDGPRGLRAPKLKERLNTVADSLLEKQFKRVCKRSKAFDTFDADERHKLRIACKNLRYNAELFGQLYSDRKVKRFIKLLKPAYDRLGELNDLRSAHELLTSIAREKPKRAGLPVGEVLGWLDRGATQTLVGTSKTIRRLRNAPAFWR